MKVAIVTVLLCVCWTHIHAGPVEIVETVAQENTVQGEAVGQENMVEAPLAVEVGNMVEAPLSPVDVETAAAEDVEENPNARLYNCPYGWMKHGTRCFLIVSDRKNWFDAETFCAEKNARLASVQSSSDYNFLVSLTTLAEESYAWIGGFWLQNVWGWSDRSPYSYTKWHSKATESSYSCLRMYSTYGWSNVKCQSTYAFVCAKDIFAC